MLVKPYCKEAERILKQLEKDMRAYSKDMSFVKSFATKSSIRKLINNGFLDIANVRKKRTTIFVLPPGVRISQSGFKFKFEKLFDL